jgi:hypothetical protein
MVNNACVMLIFLSKNKIKMMLIFLFVLLLANIASVASAKEQMQIYVSSSEAVIQYIDKLYVSRNLGTDW